MTRWALDQLRYQGCPSQQWMVKERMARDLALLRALLEHLDTAHGPGYLLDDYGITFGQGHTYHATSPQGKPITGTVAFEVIVDIIDRHGGNDLYAMGLDRSTLMRDNQLEHRRRKDQLEAERIRREYHDTLDHLVRPRSD